jgi:hypothetical protein
VIKRSSLATTSFDLTSLNIDIWTRGLSRRLGIALPLLIAAATARGTDVQPNIRTTMFEFVMP